MNEQADFFERKKAEIGVSLNQVQHKAVRYTEGPMLLLASPGSGKTTTLIMRIGYLIEEKGVDPSTIKAVTFSRASAADMKERFRRFFPQLPPIDFSTIHSFAFQVARDYFYHSGTSFQIIEGDVEHEEQADQTELPLHKKIVLRNLFKTVTGDNITDDQLEELTTYISYIKNKMIPAEEWALVKTDVPQAERVLREYERFKQFGHSKLLLDFDDMLVIAERALEEMPGLLFKYQQRYRYILTDESQDTSLIQHAIIEKLARPHKNLCVVADDDQSIYSWRGAEPSYLLDFKQKYPAAKTLFMEQNYRSSKEIVHVANLFIKRNKNRYEKNMFTHNPAGRPVKIRSLEDYNAQAAYVIKAIQKEEKLEEIAVLYRNNSSSIALINAFDRAGIPFYMKDADNRFFSHWVVEDILNFMRMTFTDRRPDLLEKIHLKMNGYVSKQQMAALKAVQNQESVFDNLLQHVPLQDYQIKALQATKETFEQMRGMPPRPAIQVIRQRLGYEKAIERMCERLGFRKDYLIGILNTLEEIADTLETMEEFAARLKHLEAVLKSAKRRKGQNAVTFSTFHSAKGLEFERVFMLDLIEGIIPSKEDVKAEERDNEALEEAARLFYVGMTRAKRQLELFVYKKRDGEKVKESQFVTAVRAIINPPQQEKAAPPQRGARPAAARVVTTVTAEGVKLPISPNALRDRSELKAGLMVKHRVFGTGKITGLNSERIELQFGPKVKQLSLAACLENGLLEPV
ncbi:ATP-dependent helicase [Paenibacillus sp. GCM10027626]|uniref:ATP-dependent helicase n=1 Tax=Paenibacillus sp. GCM10027626 TaxID=3273411 RepID=UPI00362771D1